MNLRAALFGYLLLLTALALLNNLLINPLVTTFGASTGEAQLSGFDTGFCDELGEATGIIGDVILEPACAAVVQVLADPLLSAVALVVLLMVAGALALLSTIFISLNPSAVSTILLFGGIAIVVLIVNLSLQPMWEALPGLGTPLFTLFTFAGFGLVIINGASNLSGGDEG